MWGWGSLKTLLAVFGDGLLDVDGCDKAAVLEPSVLTEEDFWLALTGDKAGLFDGDFEDRDREWEFRLIGDTDSSSSVENLCGIVIVSLVGSMVLTGVLLFALPDRDKGSFEISVGTPTVGMDAV